MSVWPSIKVKKLIAIIEKNGWKLKRREGSHRRFCKEGFPDYTIAYHDGKEIPSMALKRMAASLGLTLQDFQ
jgi:predicted RNA binding protein YcfA (HicA-like mRNA interferase family)